MNAQTGFVRTRADSLAKLFSASKVETVFSRVETELSRVEAVLSRFEIILSRCESVLSRCEAVLIGYEDKYYF